MAIAFDVITYGNGDFLRMVFNGVAAIFGEDDYMLAMRTTALLGFLAVLIKAAFSKQSLANFTAFMGMIVFYMAVVVPKVNVQVVDRITDESFVVANVPIGLGATASFFSITGDYLTKKFETVYSLPNGINYSESGMLFPQSTFKASQNFQIGEPELRENMQKYMLNCVYFDGLGQSRFSSMELIQSTDLLKFFEENTSKNITQFYYNENGINKGPLSCSKVITDYFKPKLKDKDQIKKMVSQIGASYLQRLDFNNDSDIAKFKAKSKTAYEDQYKTNQEYDSLAIQFGLINELQPVMERFGQEAGNLAYIFKKAKEDRRLKNTSAFAEALWTLPKMRDLYEAFLYAIFPVVILMSLVLPSKIPVPYITMLVWINLWAPIYSIIHFAISYWTRASVVNSGLKLGGFNAINLPQMAEHAADMANIAAWLAASTPVIAYMIVSKSGAMMSQLTSRAMQGYEQAASKASDEIVAGKGMHHGREWQTAQTEGNTSMAPGNSVTKGLNASGSTVISAPDGHEYLQATKSDLGSISVSTAKKDTESEKHTYENAVKNEQEHAALMSTANMAALKAAGGVINQLSSTAGIESGKTGTQTRVEEKAFNTIKAAAVEWGKTQNTTISNDQAVSIAGSLTASAGIGLGIGEGKSEGKSPFHAGVGGSAGITGTSTERDTQSISDTEMKKFMASEQYTEATKKIAQYALSESAKAGDQYNHTSVDNLQATLDNVNQSQESYKDSIKETQQAKRELSIASETSNTDQRDLATVFVNTVGKEKAQKIMDGLNSADPLERKEANAKFQELKATVGASNVAPANENTFNFNVQSYRSAGSTNVDVNLSEGDKKVHGADKVNKDSTDSLDYKDVQDLKDKVKDTKEHELYNQNATDPKKDSNGKLIKSDGSLTPDFYHTSLENKIGHDDRIFKREKSNGR